MNDTTPAVPHTSLVCLACFEDRLASLLETATSLRLYRVTESGAVFVGERFMPGEGLSGLPGALVRAGVDRLVCGGATCRCVEMFLAAGIRIEPWIAGRIEEVLVAIVENRVAALRAPGICPRRGGRGGPGPGRGPGRGPSGPDWPGMRQTGKTRRDS
ncbi:NifB/NifX family molybdenum-iron cluster-binding protein [Desulfolutivibrio sulfoxidireducens]|uniref:NifB/NifX family molybdenum-iron cluster-binding protein n=1 Tax=Desulfolutivibrio sulfoxidireducens TaxID=2773299 RepID=UPI00159CF78B|nr:hypothetical protein [Desulfolutivibrio sulfoxidireducens]